MRPEGWMGRVDWGKSKLHISENQAESPLLSVDENHLTKTRSLRLPSSNKEGKV